MASLAPEASAENGVRRGLLHSRVEMPLALRLPFVSALLLLVSGCGTQSDEPPLFVFAAASLQELMTEAGAAFEELDGTAVTFNFAGSNTLARQIEAAAGADLFLSADVRWIEVLAATGRLVPGSRRSLFSNRLVVVAQAAAPFVLDDVAGLGRLGFRHLAVGEPDAVPAGRYARSYLQAVTTPDGDLWSAVRERVVPTADVRAALALVKSDPEIVGVVYRTDARISTGVRVLCELPPNPTTPIEYSAALIRDGANPAAAGRFLDFLASATGRELIERFGFLQLPG